MTGYDEAVDWFRADPERVRDLDDVDNRSAAIAIVNAVLAGAVPAGRDLTAQDVRGALVSSGPHGPAKWRDAVADYLNRIARPSGGVGQPDTAEPRSWSLPAPPPEVTEPLTWFYRYPGLVHILRLGHAGEETLNHAATLVRWLLSVVEGEPPAPEPQAAEPPFAVGDRVRVKSTGKVGTVTGRQGSFVHARLDDHPDIKFMSYDADKLEPAPESQEPPQFERGFYRLARDLDTEHGVIRERLVFAAYLDTADDVWRVFCESGDAWVSVAALAAAGAVRVEEEQA